MTSRVILLVLDGLGIGAQKDAAAYESIQANTFSHAVCSNPDFQVNHLDKLGLGNIPGIKKVKKTRTPMASYGRAQEITAGNDTYAGIWEIGGIIRKKRADCFKPAIPKKTIQRIWEALDIETLCNRYQPWREVRTEFFDEHLATGKPILYTSNDGAVILTAHVNVINVPKLYELSAKLAKFFQSKDVIRVIAHPLEGNRQNIIRTPDRKDFYVPHQETEHLYKKLKDGGVLISAAEIIHGMISDRYCQQTGGIMNMEETMKSLEAYLESKPKAEKELGVFLVMECDLAGHLRDLKGVSEAIMKFDSYIPKILEKLRPDDLLIITADHGQDGSLPVRAHTREYVPLLVYNPQNKRGVNLGMRQTFADTGQTIAEIFKVPRMKIGKSFAKKVL